MACECLWERTKTTHLSRGRVFYALSSLASIREMLGSGRYAYKEVSLTLHSLRCRVAARPHIAKGGSQNKPSMDQCHRRGGYFHFLLSNRSSSAPAVVTNPPPFLFFWSSTVGQLSEPKNPAQHRRREEGAFHSAMAEAIRRREISCPGPLRLVMGHRLTTRGPPRASPSWPGLYGTAWLGCGSGPA